MRAAVLEQAGAPLTIYDDVDIEPPRAGQVRVRVTHCGVCHSDLSIVDGVFPSADADHPRARGGGHRRRGRARRRPGWRSATPSC